MRCGKASEVSAGGARSPRARWALCHRSRVLCTRHVLSTDCVLSAAPCSRGLRARGLSDADTCQGALWWLLSTCVDAIPGTARCPGR